MTDTPKTDTRPEPGAIEQALDYLQTIDSGGTRRCRARMIDAARAELDRLTNAPEEIERALAVLACGDAECKKIAAAARTELDRLQAQHCPYMEPGTLQDGTPAGRCPMVEHVRRYRAALND